MPWGDRMGPIGQGPRTGRGLGLCSGYATPGYLNAGFGRGGFGYGRGAGFGRGRGLGFGARLGYGYAAPTYSATKEDEKNILEAEIDRLTSTVEALKKRLNDIKE